MPQTPFKISLPPTFDEWVKARGSTDKPEGELRSEFEQTVMQPWRLANGKTRNRKITLK